MEHVDVISSAKITFVYTVTLILQADGEGEYVDAYGSAVHSLGELAPIRKALVRAARKFKDLGKILVQEMICLVPTAEYNKASTGGDLVPVDKWICPGDWFAAEGPPPFPSVADRPGKIGTDCDDCPGEIGTDFDNVTLTNAMCNNGPSGPIADAEIVFERVILCCIEGMCD